MPGRVVFVLVGLAACTYDFDSFTRPVAPLSLGDDFACAIRPSGQLACWGGNFSGQLATPDNFEPAPVDIPGAGNVVAVTASERAQPIDPGLNDLSGHLCIIDGDGFASCLGDNRDGQLGLPPDTSRHETLARVPDLPEVIAIDAGGSHTCAVTRAGGVLCWGANARGQLGTGDFTPSVRPASADIGGRAADVSAGRYFTCALRTDGRVLCWGGNGASEIGDGGRSDSTTPFLTGIENAIGVDTGSHHACALRRGGELVCWGSNDQGALGTSGGNGPFVATEYGEPLDAFTAGGSHTCGRTISGRHLCVGGNDVQQIGTGDTAVITAFEVAAGPDDLVVGGGWFTCAMSPSRATTCWGANWGGQLGNGEIGEPRATPARVIGFP
jgi:alpha-tubulin suppressor-like RCC1 family protein